MDAIRFGRQFHALRLRLNLRQEDVGRIAKMSRAVISRIDRGRIHNIQLGELERAAAAVGATLDIRLRWNGEQLDRLLDESHAVVVELMVSMLRAAGWEVAVEVSFSIWGERGSVDVLAFHPATGMVLVVEVKSIVPDNQEMLHALDRKTRHAREIADGRGWKGQGVSRLLVVANSAPSRRRIARLSATYETAFPVRGRDVRRWLGDRLANLRAPIHCIRSPRERYAWRSGSAAGSQGPQTLRTTAGG